MERHGDDIEMANSRYGSHSKLSMARMLEEAFANARKWVTNGSVVNG
jgi:hypothetical protein